MKRLRLASKLALAIVPIGLVALAAGGFVAWTFLERAAAQEQASRAAAVSVDAMTTLRSVWSEEQAVLLGTVSMGPVHAGVDTSLTQLKAAGAGLDATRAPGAGIVAAITDVEHSLAEVRAAETPGDVYKRINETLISIVSQASFAFEDRGAARDLTAAAALAEAARTTFQQEQVLRSTDDPTLGKVQIDYLEATFVGWIDRSIGYSHAAAPVLEVPSVTDAGASLAGGAFPVERDQGVLAVAQTIAGDVSQAGSQLATRTRNEAYLVGGGMALVLLVAGWAALLIGRSMVRRVRSVTEVARRVAEVDLPNLVDALRNPGEQLDAPSPVDMSGAGPDEVGELARSFSTLHFTLVEVARQQMEILRRGVSEIFVTLARRNRLLVDRQLALIDQLESREEDPEILGGYYKLDHLATRMRRNAESLLVLAGTDPPRVWAKPLDMNDVIRASLGEVDDYQRIDVLALEPARLSGSVVTDVAHMMSELLDNATQYSPPSDRVRVTGLFDQEGYILTISDRGLGMSEARRAELNRLLEKPPVLGLALEPTLGMYVVARLAARHGITVRLVAGVPGTTARITIPRGLLEVAAHVETPGDVIVPSDEEIAETVAPWFDQHRPTAVTNGNGSHAEAKPLAFVRSTSQVRPAVVQNQDGLAVRTPGQTVEGLDDSFGEPASPRSDGGPASPAPSEPVPVTAEAAAAFAPSPGSPGPEVATTTGLPVRTPGAFFTESVTAPDSSAPSQSGPDGIRSALSAYRTGRESAEAPEEQIGGSEE